MNAKAFRHGLLVILAGLAVGVFVWEVSHWDEMRALLRGGDVSAAGEPLNLLPTLFGSLVILLALWLASSFLLARIGHTAVSETLDADALTFLPMLLLPLVYLVYLFPQAVLLCPVLVVLVPSLIVGAKVWLWPRRPAAPTATGQQAARWLLAGAIAAFVLASVAIGLLHYYTLNLPFTHSGDFERMMWNTVHGQVFYSDGQPHIFWGTHVRLIQFLLAPFYWLSPDIRTLMALQALALGLGAVPVYLLARAAFSSPFAGLALAAAYLLHPGTSYLSADVSGEVFRMDTFGLPFTLFALYYLTQWIPASPYPGTPASVRAWPAVVFAALAVLCREEYALLLASVGVWLVFRRRWRAGALCVLVGLVWLVVMLGVLMPRFCGEPSIGLAHLESTRKSYAAIESPGGAGRVWFLVALLLPVGFLPLCHLSRLAICLPVLVLHLMNAHPQVHSILWHYHAPLMPFLYFAAPGGVRWLSKRVGDRFPRAAGNLTSALVAFAFTAALLSNVLFSRSVLSAAFHHRVPPYRQVSLADARVRLQALADLKQLIPQDASVCATEFLANHFTHFRRIRLFPDGRRDADYIVVDLHDRWLGDHVRLVHEMKTDPAFELLAEREDLCLFRRN